LSIYSFYDRRRLSGDYRLAFGLLISICNRQSFSYLLTLLPFGEFINGATLFFYDASPLSLLVYLILQGGVKQGIEKAQN